MTASLVSLAVMLGATSCTSDYTVAYVYMTTSKTQPHGLINAYQVDYQTGGLHALADSPVDSGGRNTVAVAVAPNNLALYTVNRDDSNVVQFAIGTDGKLYPQKTYSITGSFATAAAIDAQGKFLYVTFTYQNGADGQQLYTPANPGPGGVSVFPINQDNSLGTPFTVNAGRNPMGVIASPKAGFVYVVEQDSATSANLLGFAENTTTGALTALPGVSISAGNTASAGYPVGTAPLGLLEDSSATHLYVTDQAANTVSVYAIAASGVPTLTGTVATDAGPEGMTFDLSSPGKYLYVVNTTANTLNTFTVAADGSLTRSAAGGTVPTGTGPTCVSVIGAPRNTSPSHAEYMYISNSLSNNVSGEQVNQQDGSLEQIQGTPFVGSTLPTCLVTVPALPLR